MHVGFEGKVALVTGGSRGIGKGIAREFVDGGGSVMLCARKEDDLKATAAELGPSAAWCVANVSDEQRAAECVAATLGTFGRLDILVNNAGINPQWGPTIDVDAALAAKLAQVNLWAVLLWSQVAWRRWLGDHGGVILNVTSVGGLRTEPYVGYYAATKAAASFLTRQLAAELAPAVRVNAIAPGLVETDMARGILAEGVERFVADVPLGRLAQVRDIAAAAAFLCSDQAAFITGQVLAVDGGGLAAI
jgi:NAD(P)-dependent dehydrogenase (short-subunit alcohol dehydrogenase family)